MRLPLSVKYVIGPRMTHTPERPFITSRSARTSPAGTPHIVLGLDYNIFLYSLFCYILGGLYISWGKEKKREEINLLLVQNYLTYIIVKRKKEKGVSVEVIDSSIDNRIRIWLSCCPATYIVSRFQLTMLVIDHNTSHFHEKSFYFVYKDRARKKL